MARSIQPVEVSWNSQVMYTLTSLNVNIITDDLSSMCALYFTVLDSDGNMRKQGNYYIQGEDYTNWDGNNDYPYQYVATQENLTLI